MLHDENVSIFVYIYEKKICRIVFLSVYVHVMSFLFLNANNKVLAAFCVTFPNLIFVFLCWFYHFIMQLILLLQFSEKLVFHDIH